MKIWFYKRADFLYIKKKDYDFPVRFKWSKDKLINLLNVYKILKGPWNSEITTQKLIDSNYMKKWKNV